MRAISRMLLPCRLKTRISTASSTTNMALPPWGYSTSGWVNFQSATWVSFAPAATSSPIAAASVSVAKRLTTARSLPAQAVGIKEVHDDIWLVSFMDYDLGYFDLETRVREPLDNPFGPRLSPM